MNYTKDQIKIFQICVNQNHLFGLDSTGRVWVKYVGENGFQGQWLLVQPPESQLREEELVRA